MGERLREGKVISPLWCWISPKLHIFPAHTCTVLADLLTWHPLQHVSIATASLSVTLEGRSLGGWPGWNGHDVLIWSGPFPVPLSTLCCLYVCMFVVCNTVNNKIFMLEILCEVNFRVNVNNAHVL